MFNISNPLLLAKYYFTHNLTNDKLKKKRLAEKETQSNLKFILRLTYTDDEATL